MKRILCSLLLTAGILMSTAATTQATPSCQWLICSEIDCSLTFQLYITCSPNPPVALFPLPLGATVGGGCWGSPTCVGVPISSLYCNPSATCTYSLTINGITYNDGDIICCTPTPPDDCSSCNCAYVQIDPTNKTIRLVPATSGPGWDCTPLR